MSRPTLFESLGGMDGVLRLAHAWHERCLADTVVEHAFSHGYRADHSERLAAYWAEAWGGPAAYSAAYGTESAVVRMHSGNGRHDDMNAHAIDCFAMALDDIALRDPVLKRVLLDYFTWTTTRTMTAFPRSPDDVPEGLRMPRWSWAGLDQSHGPG